MNKLVCCALKEEMEINIKREGQSFPVRGAAGKSMERILDGEVVRHLSSLVQALPLPVQPRLSQLLPQSLNLIAEKGNKCIQNSVTSKIPLISVLNTNESWPEKKGKLKDNLV